MNKPIPKCASCTAFPLDEAVKAGGSAMCDSRLEMHAWDDQACVLHNNAKDIQARRVLVAKLSGGSE